MRRSLILTVAAAVAMVLLAMLVPMAILLRDYALEDRLASAALEVQATETVVSGAGDDDGDVSVYLDRINADSDTLTTVLYPGSRGDIGPQPGEDDRVLQARQTGQARVDDVDGGAQILVPVSLGGSSGGASTTPVIRVFVPEPGLTSGPTTRAYLVLAGLGLVLLLGALLIADRVGRSFVQPIGGLATWAQTLGDRRTPPSRASGPRRGPRPRRGPPPARRSDRGAARARAAAGLRPLAPPPHADHRAAACASRPCRRRASAPGSPTTSTGSR